MSELLQDILREKKQEARRISHHMAKDGDSTIGQDAREVQSSPAMPSEARIDKMRAPRAASSISNRTVSMPKDMGLREMEEVCASQDIVVVGFIDTLQSITKLKKKNFDLKLELFHRRQRADTLEEQLKEKDSAIESLEERAVSFENERAEAMRLQDELLQELERRDEAVTEAVTMILKLEAEVRRLTGRGGGRESTDGDARARAESTLSSSSAAPGPSTASLSQQSQQEAAGAVKNATKEQTQQSSVLRRDLSSSRALRSLYDSDDHGGSQSYNRILGPMSVTSGDEDVDGQTVDRDIIRSPSLSVLSESSFLSVYGRSELSDAYGDTTLRSKSPNHDGFDMASLDRDLGLVRSSPPMTRQSSGGQQSATAAAANGVRSIGKALESTSRTCVPRPQSHDGPQPVASRPRLPKSSFPDHHAPSFGGPIFGTPALPPTPDTLGTVPSTAHSSAHSVVAERSQAEATLPDRLQGLLPTTGFAQAHPRHARHHASDPPDDTWSSDGDSLPSLRPAHRRRPVDTAQRDFATTQKALRTVGLNPYERSRYGSSPPFREPSGAPSSGSAASSAAPRPRARRASVDPAALPAERPLLASRKASEHATHAPADVAPPPRDLAGQRLAAARSPSHASKSSRGAEDRDAPPTDAAAPKSSPAKGDPAATARPTLAARILRRGSTQPAPAPAAPSSPSTHDSTTPAATPTDVKRTGRPAAATDADAHRPETRPALARAVSTARPEPPPHRHFLPHRAQSHAATRRPGTAGSVDSAAPAPPAIRRARPRPTSWALGGDRPEERSRPPPPQQQPQQQRPGTPSTPSTVASVPTGTDGQDALEGEGEGAGEEEEAKGEGRRWRFGIGAGSVRGLGAWTWRRTKKGEKGGAPVTVIGPGEE